MAKFKAESTSNHEFATKKEVYEFEVENMVDARHWVINHLDCSRQWKITEVL